MTESIPNHISPLVKEHNAAVFYFDGTWHRTESYPIPCTCGIHPQGVIKPAVDESWKYCESKDVAGCLDVSIKADPTLSLPSVTPSPVLQLGDRVELDASAAALFDQGRSGEWFIEGFGKRNEDSAPIVRILDKRTSVYALAPLSWVKKWVAPEPVPPRRSACPDEGDECRMSIPITPTEDEYLWCIVCGGDHVTHEFSSRSTQGRRSTLGIHLECARGIVGGGVNL